MNIKIQEKEFTLKYNNKALFKIEKELNVGIIKLFSQPKELEKLSTIYTVVWAGIQEPITFDEFSELATFDELGEILPKVIEEVGASFDTGAKKK